ncbi:efflux RND transporter periplasmic adaptor subunit [Maribacter polysiphoniae]|uniref:Efflux RND transporter periplasmic adaptor subunit n=1 Tax=Maribacter polysiphoniae TaxID=429344 RepID=A0A316DVY8_9FLAO|nr:efflux RND transporter periplasmic adaptor subunit [Maribacter polysiphoniae]MBD1262217.1 efflux RND transporter periplasmic adaptor subunit [Maribacter polysiphoniae]PWK21522.1 RND family efflux transporter MFP subunit [Maribacter polysiphoniae]
MKVYNLFFITVLLILSSCSEKKEEAKESKILKVGVTKIAANTENETLSYSGTIEADNTVSLGFMVAGRVADIHVQEGQKVKKGQLLAAIDATSYKNAYDIADAGLELANDNYKRLDELYKKGSLPERDYIAVKVGVAQANANKNMAAKNLSDTKLYAPFSGMVTAKLTEIGATAAPGVPAFTVMKTDKVYAKASISESEISKLKVGSEAEIEIPSMNKSFTGKVAILNLSADTVTRTFNVKVRVDNSENQLLPGMISSIKINTDNPQEVISIPVQSIVRDVNDITYAFIVENNKAIKKRVDTGDFKGNQVIITKGLSAGDLLISKGYTTVKDGQEVTF